MRKRTSKIVAFFMASVLAFSNATPAMASLSKLDYDAAIYDQLGEIIMGDYKKVPALDELIPTESHIVRTFSLNDGSPSDATPSAPDRPNGGGSKPETPDMPEQTELATDTNALMARAELASIGKEEDLEPYIKDPILRSIIFDAVKDGAEGAVGSDIEEALGNYKGSISAKSKGITDPDGIQYLRKAAMIDLSKNEIKDWSALADPGERWYGYRNEYGDWTDVTWNLGGNPFERIPSEFGGRLVIKQPGTMSYTYNDASEFSFVRGDSDSCETTMDVGKCFVVDGSTERPVKLVSVATTVPPHTFSSPILHIERIDNSLVKLTDITRSGTQLIAVGMDQEIHYRTADEYDTITPGSQSAKYYVKAKVALYDKITVKSSPYKGSVELTKTSSEDSAKRVPGAVYKLYREGAEYGTYTTDAQGKITVMKLDPGRYYFRETSAPPGYELNPQDWNFEIVEHKTTISGGEKTVSLPGGIIENAGENSVFIAGPQNYGNTKDIVLSRRVNDDTKLKVTVNYSSLNAAPGVKGEAIKKVFYSVKEAENDINSMKNQNKITGSVNVDVEYIETASGAVKVSATNTPLPPPAIPKETIEVSGKKTWVDESGYTGLHPDIIIHLERSDNKTVDYASLILHDGQEEFHFSNLPKLDDSGNEYEYTVSESFVDPAEKSKFIAAQDGYNFTNTYNNITTDIEGMKNWDDGGAEGIKHPVVTIVLNRNGEKFDTRKIASGQDSYSFRGLPVKDEANVPYAYTVEEVKLDGYTSILQSNGRDFLNTYIPPTEPPVDPEKPTITIKGKKTWDDRGRNLTHPDVTIDLYRDGIRTIKSTVIPSGSSEYSFTNLPECDSKGRVYVYSVEERLLTRYTSSKVGDYDFLNTYDPPTSGGGNTGGNPPGGNNTPPSPGGPGIPPTDPGTPPPTDPGITPPTPEYPPTPPDEPGKPNYPVYPKGRTPDPENPNSPPKITVIDEQGVPRAYIKVLDKKTGKYVYILDESVPLGLPKTGDSRSCVSLLVFAGSTASVILLEMSERKKKKKA